MIYEFAATQDLHGYGKPWAPGAGKNLLSWENVYKKYYSSGAWAGSGENVTNFLPAISFWGSIRIAVTPGDQITVSNAPAVGGVNGLFTEEDGETKVGDSWGSASNNATRTVPEGAAYMWLGVNVLSSSDIRVTYSTAQAEIGSTATAFEPYANICMPEGFNIWDPYNAEFIQIYAGYVNANTRELYLRPVYEEYDGEELVGPWMSSLDPYEEDTTPTTGAFVIDFGGELTSYEITPFMLQTLLDSLGIRQHFTDGAGLLNSLMDQAQGRVRSEEELLHLSRPLKVIPIGDQLPAGLTFKPISKDVLPGLPGKFIR